MMHVENRIGVILRREWMVGSQISKYGVFVEKEYIHGLVLVVLKSNEISNAEVRAPGKRLLCRDVGVQDDC